MTVTFDDNADMDGQPDLPAAVPQGAWFSVAGTDDPAVLCPEAFAQGGPVDGMRPGALLAALAEGACDPAGLAAVSDNALLGMVGASQRLAARAAAVTQRAVAEYARRHRTQEWRRATRGGYTEFAPDDLAPELAVNPGQAEYAMMRHEGDQRRLPACSQALWDGLLGEYPLKIIADQTACLDDAGAAEADQILAREAPSLTPGQLRALAARVVLMIDPDAAEERRRDAATRARVVKYREDAGTGALCGRDLPPDAVLRSWQHIDGTAQALKATGIKAGLDKLRAAVYLALTSGTSPLAVLPLLCEYPGEPLTPDGGGTRPSGGGGPSGPSAGVVAPFQAVINLMVPAGTAFGWSSAPGEIAGWGPLDPETTRDMMAAVSRHPGTRWCLTLVQDDGTAVAHGCAPGRHPWTPPWTRDPDPGGGERDGPGPAQQAADFLADLRVRLAPVARGTCDHAQCTDSYEVPRTLKHLIAARTATCTAPCCNRSAPDGDADHTVPWPEGPTCQANLGPVCRRHHRCKQDPEWLLDQPEPGTFRWAGPSGRVRITYPTRYLL